MGRLVTRFLTLVRHVSTRPVMTDLRLKKDRVRPIDSGTEPQYFDAHGEEARWDITFSLLSLPFS